MKRAAITSVVLLVLAVSVHAQSRKAQSGARSIAPAVASRADFPVPSRIQEPREVPRKSPRSTADKPHCIVDYACYCDGPLTSYGYCWPSSTCKPLSNNFCAYWCDNWQMCATLSAQDCENYSCGW